MMKQIIWVLAGLAVLGGLLSAGRPLLRTYEAILVMADAAAGPEPSRLKKTTPAPRRTSVSYRVADRSHTADLYLPGNGQPAAAIVLVPGAVPQGKDEPRLVAFAQTLARARFAVLAPDLPGFRRLQIGPGDTRDVADAFAFLASRADLAPDGRAGIGAFSYAVGPALLAAMEPDIRERVRFIVGVGGYHNLDDTIRFFTTGYFRHGEAWQHMEPDEYGKLVFVRTARAYLGDAGDVALLDAMVERRLRDRAADLADLAARLGPEGRSVYALVTNGDPERFAALAAALPARLQADLAALSLHNKDLAPLAARLILVHGRNDRVIPYAESIALADAVRPGQARLFLIDRLLGHVDMSPGRVFSQEFLRRELPDLWRMGRAVWLLLRERR